MPNFNKKQIIMFVSILVIIFGTIFAYIIKSTKERIDSMESDTYEIKEYNSEDENMVLEEMEIDLKDVKIMIDISGEVVSPGIKELEYGKRVQDAIDLAGGLTENADISKINLAYILKDEEKIIIPKKEENIEEHQEVQYIYRGSSNINNSSNNNNEPKKININTASKAELVTITGIGESTADKIINYREKTSKFKKIEDIKNVPGIGDAKFEAIKEQIST